MSQTNLFPKVEHQLGLEISAAWKDMQRVRRGLRRAEDADQSSQSARRHIETLRHYEDGYSQRLRALLHVRRAARATVPLAVTPPAPECDCAALANQHPRHAPECAITAWMWSTWETGR